MRGANGVLQSMETSLEAAQGSAGKRGGASPGSRLALRSTSRSDLCVQRTCRRRLCFSNNSSYKVSGRARALDLADAATEIVKAATSRDRAHCINRAHCA